MAQEIIYIYFLKRYNNKIQIILLKAFLIPRLQHILQEHPMVHEFSRSKYLLPKNSYTNQQVQINQSILRGNQLDQMFSAISIFRITSQID